ncbi:aminodeoxychorismate/anthranilate synthase component II [Helicobacter muridarum]|uniref:Aminodeoxychorismate/anthranilate synthase component II n=1 Tax=Helicobacter muridarum TaxID=216 RepID=A0A099U0E8_9HELI|nr:aminodeoxychorismate/anthranilate synthase component II [Helicobacter muridarum]TLE00160.1 aminodeoxychorismate/anthranilate synthase component II [Helicobacter muridarum]STQ87034.1 para-aminobenzoate synthase glutamine amidotransferase component II [Helicobacter muridarum]
MNVLLLDNYDSFTYNIIYKLRSIGVNYTILQNDCSLQDIKTTKFTHLIVSPGPSSPKESGISLQAIAYFAPIVPILGICLGHQCIAEVFGGEVNKMKTPIHAKSSTLSFIPDPLFKGIKQNLRIALYHSLHVTNPGECKILGFSKEGIVMALRHRKYPCYGIQFHPESILQQQGRKIIKNFLSMRIGDS